MLSHVREGMLMTKLISKTLSLAMVVGVFALNPAQTLAQCGTLLDGDGVETASPVYYECNDGSGSFEFWPLSSGTWTNVTVDWGDGTAPEFFAEWSETIAIHHVYTYVDHQTFNLTFTTASCSATATLEKSVLVNPSIVVPEGWPTGACAPATLSFVNNSQNVTPDTEFTWTFDDGTTVTAGPENEGATVDHLYAAFTTGCQRDVTLSATNACRTSEFGVPAAVTIDYINIWDRDNPIVDASATTLCWPENTVDLWNISEKVCLENGNTEQRKERWNFGGPYGPAGIEEIDWRPWTNSNPVQLTFPSTGTYTIWLAIENYCGIDSAAIDIVVREPLTATVTGPVEVCEGDRNTFTATAADADWFEWDFYGTDSYWYPSTSGNMIWTYNSAGTYELAVNVGLENQSESCTATATHTITVKPKPRAEIALSSAEGCDELSTTVTETYGEGASYTWTWPENAMIVATPSGTMATMTEVGTHAFAVEVTDANGCTAVANATAEVFPSPSADFTAGTVCEGNVTAFTDLSLPSGSDTLDTWAWTFGDAGTSSERHPDYTYSSPGTYLVTLQVSDAHCSATASEAVTVNASPTLDISSDLSEGCSPLYVDFEATSDGSVVWEFGDGNGDNGSAVSHIYLGNPTTAVLYEVAATATNAFGCYSEAAMTVRTLPSADASFSVSPAECSPFTPVFTNESERATSYLWIFEDGTTSDAFEPTQVFTNTTGYQEAQPVELIAYSENGCNDTTGAAVSVYPEALFNMTLDQNAACSPFSMMAPAVNGAENHMWDFGDGTPGSVVPNPVHVYENNTDEPLTYTLTLNAENSFGCPGSVSRDIVINPTPVAEFTADIQSGCAPLTVTFEESSQRAATYSWDYGDANTATGLNGVAHEHTFELGGFDLAARAVTLTVEADGGCSDTHTVAIELYPEVVANPVGELEACAPWQSDLVAEGYEGATTHSITWTVDGGETFEGAALQRTFVGLEGADQTLTFDLNITSPYGCSSDATVEATVHHLPVADFELSEVAACAGTEIDLDDRSMYADQVTLDWGEGEGPQADAGSSHVFTNFAYEPVVVELVQTATTDYGCQAQAFVNHTVYPQVTADFLPPAPACAPFTLTLVNQSSNANGTFTWDFGDGSPVSQSAQPSHLYETPADANSVYTISLHATSTYGCEDSTSHDVEVHATPVADMEVVREEGCYPLEVTFANHSVGGDTYNWTYGTGLNSTETADEHTVEYFNPTSNIVTYTAVLTVSTDAGCSSQDVTYIEVLPEVEARIEGGMTGCAPLEIDFLNLSDGAANYAWDFGDGGQSAATHANHVFTTDPGEDATYTVSMVATSVYGCTDTAHVQVHVYAAPVADFVTSSTQLTFPNTDVTVTNTSTAGESADHYWTFGDGQVSYEANPGTHDYGTWGTYDITLEVDNGYCSSVASTAVQILAPTPTIGFTGEGAGCAPLTVQFNNLSTYASSYRWEFSDGSVRSDDSPVHVFNEPGIYDVTLYVEGYEGTELVESHTAVVEVFPTAKAVFSLNPNHVMVPGQPVFFLNLSEGATEYMWDFGDGATSISETPVHEYLEAGVYDVTLTANNEWGCSSTYTLPEAVLAEEGGMMVFPNAFTPSSTGSNGGYYDPTGYDNDVFRPMHAGVESYELMVFTKWGEMIFYSNDINIGWDGYIQGRLASTDVYAWKATATLSNGEKLQRIGNVTLLAR
jgi:PKD repeat protein